MYAGNTKIMITITNIDTRMHRTGVTNSRAQLEKWWWGPYYTKVKVYVCLYFD